MVLQNYIVNRKKGTPTMAEEKETKNPVQSAERIFQVLEMLAEHGEMGLMEISTELGLHKSTVHRLLMSLIYMGYAKQDETTQKYMLSYKIVSMAGKILERTDILQIAKPYMERLSDISGEAVHLVQREGNNILYIYKIEAKVNGKWQPVCSGESVGHKRIEKFDPIEASALRLTIPESVALPDIINFSTYYIK